MTRFVSYVHHFNPRSLTGATVWYTWYDGSFLFQSTLPHGSDREKIMKHRQEQFISIHAPSRERPMNIFVGHLLPVFQSTLPHGSDPERSNIIHDYHISIHAPSRERRSSAPKLGVSTAFQSTLPHGSDAEILRALKSCVRHFNPRSLTGATVKLTDKQREQLISIHAPSRERPIIRLLVMLIINFNPRSLTGATPYKSSGTDQ